MIVKQAYSPITKDTESDPGVAPSETDEFQPPSTRSASLSSDHTPILPDRTPVSPLTNEEFEASEPSDTRIISPHSTTPSDSTTPLSPNHLLTQTAPTPTPARAFFYRRTARMDRYMSSYETPYSLPALASPQTLPLRRGIRLGERRLHLEQHAAPVEDTAADGPLGLGYRAARRRALELAEDAAPSTYEIWQSSRSVADQHGSDETPTPRLPIRTTWVDPRDGVVYTDIECDIPSVHLPVQSLSSPAYIPSSLGWSLAPSSKSPASLTVPTLIASPATSSPVASPTIAKHGGSAVVRDEIFSQRFRLRSLEQVQERSTVTFTALWRPVLALEASVGQTDTQRAALWQARYKDQREIHALRMHHAADQHEMQGLRERERVATLKHMMDRLER
ncbi:hypothetical protein Tco_0016078 [Tanacetum coccineum]